MTYSLAASADGTRFRRVFVYPAPDLPFALLNRISIRGRIEAESEQALRNLKRSLESPA